MTNGDIPRRNVLGVAAAGLAAGSLGSGDAHPADGGAVHPGGPPAPDGEALDGVRPDGNRYLGRGRWGNRWQDWQRVDGRIECVRPGLARTVALTEQVLAASGGGSATLTVRTGTLRPGRGRSGFLIGVGRGRLDPRASMLAQGVAGEAGGILCCYESDGRVRFRDHTSERDQRRFAVLRNPDGAPAVGRRRRPRHPGGGVRLTLRISPRGRGRVRLRLTAEAEGRVLSTAELDGVPAREVAGGILLVSGHDDRSGARHWFAEPELTGDRLRPTGLRLGPILGTMFSVNTRPAVLRMTAVLMPLGPNMPRRVVLQVRRGGRWQTVDTATVNAAGAATFRVAGWDFRRSWRYRVVWAAGEPGQDQWTGRIPANPRQLSLASINCTVHTARPLDAPSPRGPEFPEGCAVGLYTPQNLYFPYAELVRRIAARRPNLLVASGDQYYEHRPTGEPADDRALDTRYRFALWLLAFRGLTRSIPCIVQVDDHDVLQGNLYGWGGKRALPGRPGYGGYLAPARLVNVVQALQCAHNPDPFDPTPIKQGITVYYGQFRWAGVRFAIVEDRKFKNSNKFGTTVGGRPLPGGRQLLGRRQEEFLRHWARTEPGDPHVVLTQTLWGAATTLPDGRGVRDSDSGGAVPAARRRALRIIKSARGVVISGDQHLATVVRHGIDGRDDGPVQFTAPAAGSLWQRWFAPAHTLARHRGRHTGDWTDRYGNRMRVLAVANPRLSFRRFQSVHGGDDNDLIDRSLKSEGFGVLRIERGAGHFTLECWPWDEPRQFDGWPLRLRW